MKWLPSKKKNSDHSEKKNSGGHLKEINIETLDFSVLVFDLAFFISGIAVFYHTFWSVPIGIVIVFLKFKFLRAFKKSNELLYLESFIDFLNHLNSQLSVGMTFEKALLSLENSRNANKLTHLMHTVKLGVTAERLYQAMRETFPIEDCSQYCDLLLTGRQLGVDPAFITGKTLEIIAYKQQIVSEIHRILYQKKMEQMILVFAPIVIVVFVSSLSPDYLAILYETSMGRIIMTLALALIILMKVISERIVKIDI
ncbi:MAG: tight adherence protein [Clostridiales bacterium]|jgi:tight adherence protein B|nr:tight adherence protein [Clostridiales bacterium]